MDNKVRLAIPRRDIRDRIVDQQEIDDLLPSQATPEWGKEHLNIRRLMASVVHDAFFFMEQRLERTRHDPVERWLYDREYQWFFAENDAWLFSFERICQVLRIDPEVIRDEVRLRFRHPSAIPGNRRKPTSAEARIKNI